MLVSFTFENWRSFRDANKLNLVATTEEEHRGRVPEIKDYNFRLLPTAAIYGGNASGKSNLFKALLFAHWFITKGPGIRGGIPVDPFRLDEKSVSTPLRFGFLILVQDKNGQEQIYDYGFTIDQVKVLEEKLVWISKESEVVLFERKDEEVSCLHETIKENTTLCAVLATTRDNQLCLTNAASQNTNKYKAGHILEVFRWFTRLTLISPDTKVRPDAFLWGGEKYNRILSMLETGIVKLVFKDVPLSSVPLPQKIIEEMKADLRSDKEPGCIIGIDKGKTILLSIQNNELVAKQLFSIHMGSDLWTEVPFDLQDDSEGTVRVIDLLPCFLEASRQGSKSIFVIDEIDRSLHTLLLRQLLESYLASCSPGSRSQIIFTTHDVLQMDQDFWRLDEIWVTDRKKDGSTELIPFSSFKGIREDKSIRTSYLRGQLGGTPKLLLFGAFPQEDEEENP
jgi:AAA15 family ATPase/GTPase